nr:dihydroorotate dehydrogenase electron transfer subunit [Clostridiales bacterium]
IGPLGSDFKEEMSDEKCVVIGGGIGVPPMLGISDMFENVDAILGFRSAENAILISDFNENCNNVFLTSDDGTIGYHGFVTDVLKDKIEQYEVVFACGPKPMLKAVADIAKQNSKPCFVSLEERMGCGIGACLVCACKTKEKDGEHYRHVCKDGPIFNAEEVEW